MAWHTAHDASFASNSERRRGPRFRCSGRVQIRVLPWSGTPAIGRISDLSLRGCRVETDFPFQPGTQAEVSLLIDGIPVRATSQIRRLCGHSGIGVEFTRLTRRSSTMLEELIHELAARREVLVPAATAAASHRPLLHPSHLSLAQVLVPDSSLVIVGTILPPQPSSVESNPGEEEVAPAAKFASYNPPDYFA